jgi:hypothetical protein
MSVFYRGPRAVITQDALVVAHTRRRRYAIAELTAFHIVRQEPPDATPERFLGLSALAAALLVVPILGRASVVLATAALLVLAGSAAQSLRRPAVEWQLMANYRGRATALFSSVDQREFDQVCRGLCRCLEYRERLR